MSSVLNMLNSLDDNGLNLVIIVPLFAVVVAALTLLIKFSFRKPEVTKKTQNSAKKQQKSQTANSSKQKEEKVNSEKKEKVVKEKNSSSPNKSVEKQTGNDSGKSNKKQQQNSVDEKVSKKNSAQTKKNQVNNNVNTKNNASSTKNNSSNKKQQQTVDIFVNKEEEGEWQMVTTKKQKQTKQEEKVEIAKTPTKTNKKSQKPNEKANKQPNNKTKKAKEVTDKSDSSTKLIHTEATPEEIKEPKGSIKATTENVIPAALETTKVDTNSNITKNISVNNNEAITVVEPTPIANVAFDELGDDGWTDTKPQKKNRKRALRE